MILALRCAHLHGWPVDVSRCSFLPRSSASTASVHQFAVNHKKLADYNQELQNAYKIMGLEENVTVEQLKDRFVTLAKEYHPDTAKDSKGNATKFNEVRNAYRFIVKHTQLEEKHAELNEFCEEVVYDIRHTAPQHRQYLEYGGVGAGNPFQRQRQYQQHRVAKATENTYEYLLDKRIKELEKEFKLDSKSLRNVTREQAFFAKKQKTTNAVERLVEDMILQSMKRGDFNNLKGMGKPLKNDESNPYIDVIEYKLNKILINNGFAPPWIMKEMELRTEITSLRNEARYEYARYLLCKEKDFKGQFAIESVERRWNATIKRIEKSIVDINKRIQDYNLITPSLNRQFFNLSLKVELDKAIAEVSDESGDRSHWTGKARSSINTFLSSQQANNESLLSQFIKGLIALKNL
uniref:DnaJ subfamily C member 28 n=1 Tax=Ascaris suum TaxID=6253 RepID=F1L6D7_ASCSU